MKAEALSEKLTVYSLDIEGNGQPIIYGDISSFMRGLRDELAMADLDTSYSVRKTTMPEEEFKNLPEHEGW